MVRTTRSPRAQRLLTALVLVLSPLAVGAAAPTSQPGTPTESPRQEIPAASFREDAPAGDFRHGLFVSAAIPLTGGFNVSWSRPVAGRLVLSSFLAYFDRSWFLIVEPSDWHSYSGYVGAMLQWYPTARSGQHRGYFVGGDIGLATSYQTYRPTGKGDIFWFPFIDLYLLGYTFNLWRGLYLDAFLGGGYAPVGPIVKVDGHKHDSGDFYQIADLRLGYRW